MADKSDATDRVVGALDDPVASVRLAAAMQAGMAPASELVAPLVARCAVEPDDDVARTAWRAAAGLVPTDAKPWLAERLSSQWGRGGRDVRLSLSQALCSLGDAALPVIERATASDNDDVRLHALATKRILDDPDLAFDAAMEEARRVHTLRGAPLVNE